jgi:Domain of Unknown Function (DUF928)
MNYFKTSLPLQKKTLALALVWSILGGIPTPAQTPLTQPNSSAASLDTIVFSVPDLTGRGRPGDRSGGASRGGCKANANPKDLVALIPDTNLNPSVGLTVDEYPTFWFNVPYPANDFHAIEFELLERLDGQENLPADQQEFHTVYKTQLATALPLPGIISFRLPQTATPLEAKTTYKWFVKVYCQAPDPEDPDTPIVWMGGSIIRTTSSPELESELSAATSDRDRALVYARYGIWYNALTEIGNLRRAGSATADWEKLLSDIGLNGIADKPIIDCCLAASEP